MSVKSVSGKLAVGKAVSTQSRLFHAFWIEDDGSLGPSLCKAKFNSVERHDAEKISCAKCAEVLHLAYRREDTPELLMDVERRKWKSLSMFAENQARECEGLALAAGLSSEFDAQAFLGRAKYTRRDRFVVGYPDDVADMMIATRVWFDMRNWLELNTSRLKECFDVPEIRQIQLQAMSYDEFLETPEWRANRERALKFAEFRCQACNSDGRLSVHHRDYSCRGRERLSDLIVLCADCHTAIHGRGPARMRVDRRVAGRHAAFAEAFKDEE